MTSWDAKAGSRHSATSSEAQHTNKKVEEQSRPRTQGSERSLGGAQGYQPGQILSSQTSVTSVPQQGRGSHPHAHFVDDQRHPQSTTGVGYPPAPHSHQQTPSPEANPGQPVSHGMGHGQSTPQHAVDPRPSALHVPGQPTFQGELAGAAQSPHAHARFSTHLGSASDAQLPTSPHDVESQQIARSQHSEPLAERLNNPPEHSQGEEHPFFIEADQELPPHGTWNHEQRSRTDEENRTPPGSGASGLSPLLLPHLSKLVGETQKYLNAVSGVLQALESSLELESQLLQRQATSRQSGKASTGEPERTYRASTHSQAQGQAGGPGHEHRSKPSMPEELIVSKWQRWLRGDVAQGAQATGWGRPAELLQQFPISLEQGTLSVEEGTDLGRSLVVLTYSRPPEKRVFAVPIKPNSANVPDYFTTSNENIGGNIQDLIRPCELDPENLSVLRKGEVSV